MIATWKKWATDLLTGAGIAVLGLVLLAGGGSAKAVIPVEVNAQCPNDDTGVVCKFTEKECQIVVPKDGRCGVTKYGCDCLKK